MGHASLPSAGRLEKTRPSAPGAWRPRREYTILTPMDEAAAARGATGHPSTRAPGCVTHGLSDSDSVPEVTKPVGRVSFLAGHGGRAQC